MERGTQNPPTGGYPTYCARPACRREFRSVQGRYCSAQCAQLAVCELRQARSRLHALTAQVRQAADDVAAFHTADMGNQRTPLDIHVAVSSARAALRYLPAGDPGVPELQALADAADAGWAVNEVREGD